MPLRPRTVAARAPLRDEQPGPGFRTGALRHQLDPHLDPWIGVDHFHMAEPHFRAHPHAGFSAVTYLFEDSPGAMRSRDSLGGTHRIAPGSLLWTQAGSGVVHEEVPERRGTDCHGVQMFVNLSAANELAPPRMFALATGEVPEIAARGCRVRVLAGAALGARSPLIELLTPVTLLDVHLEPGAELRHVASAAHHAWAIAIRGAGTAGPTELELRAGGAVAFAPDGDAIQLRAGDLGLHALVAHAAPLREPVVWGGPFALSSPDRLAEVERRWRAGALGALEASF